MKKTALAVMRLQPMHEGHKILIEKMLELCDDVIIAVGSAQESRTDKNPFSYEERKKMLLDVFPDSKTLSIIPLADIGAKSKKEWTDYLIKELKKNSLPSPTHYFSGSKEDADWYTQTGWDIIIVDRFTVGKGISATKIRENMKNSRNLSDSCSTGS